MPFEEHGIFQSFKILDQELPDHLIVDQFRKMIFEDSPVVKVEADCEECAPSKMFELSVADNVTVLSRSIRYSQKINVYPLLVRIAIGECRFKNGKFEVSKCSADLLYNGALEPVDVDFHRSHVHTWIHE